MFGNRLSRNAQGALLIATLTVGLIGISAGPAAASRSCGTTSLNQGGRARVFIARGSISCSVARGVVKLYGTGRVRYRCKNGARSCYYSTYPHGWRCGALEQGGSICWRGGNNSGVGARDVVQFSLLFRAARASSSSSAASAPDHTARAAACAKERVNGGKYLGELTLRFGSVGRVSCVDAHHLARTYFHKFATGQGGQQNNFCDLTIDGWSCSFFFATEVQQTGGAKAGCTRQHGGSESQVLLEQRSGASGRGALAATLAAGR